MPATHPYIPRVAIVFDFDKTLASDTIDALCAAWGLERDEWETKYSAAMGDGWDGIIRRGQALIACGKDRGEPLTQEFFAKAADEIVLYDGVRELRGRLTRAVEAIHAECALEMVVLSSGYAEMINETDVANHFDAVWAGAFHFDENGEAVCVKRIIGHKTKATYIEAYAKGLDLDNANEPRTEDPDLAEDDMHVLFDQLIYVGDGLSDLDAFEFVTNSGGLAIAIDESAQFDHDEQQTERQRVENLARPDFGEDSELMRSLTHAVQSAASRVALRKMGRGE